ncbi:hypothetical protein FACS1894180_3860 [Bacteroidia bacterium]|nr:hypothetical protein FACS1894180_3860 [Bacteroidia bacterium]
MKKSNRFLIAAVLLLAASAGNNAFAQSVSFGYDAAGNRVARTVVLPASSNAPRLQSGEDETPPEPFVEQLAQDLQVKIYPNPTKGLLQVELNGLDSDETAQITVFSTNGTLLLQTAATAALTPVDMSAYPAGVYVLTLTIRGKPTDYKIIKK